MTMLLDWIVTGDKPQPPSLSVRILSSHSCLIAWLCCYSVVFITDGALGYARESISLLREQGFYVLVGVRSGTCHCRKAHADTSAVYLS
jgi:hypothetical protein